jgi:hypothetical protein
VPEPVLASTTIPIISPRVASIPLPQAATPAQAPIQAVSPEDANAAAPAYPGIPEPGQDLVSIQATVARLKEIVEMMTGTRAGGSETDVVGGHLLLQKSSANSSARLEEINQVTANANFAMAAHILILDAEFRNVTGEDPTGTTFKAHLDETLQVYTDADEAIALRTLNMEVALDMTSGTSASARLNTIEQATVTDLPAGISAVALRATYLETELHMNATTHLSARLSTIEQATVTDLPAGISAVANRTTDLEVELEFNTTTKVSARLQTVEDVSAHADASGARAELKFGVHGSFGSSTALPAGYFEFSGVYYTDPNSTPPGLPSTTYNMVFAVNNFFIKDPSTAVPKTVFQYSAGKFTFTGDVEINGSLVVNGTIINEKIGYQAVSRIAAAAATLNAGGFIGAAVTVRQAGRVLVVVTMNDGSYSFRSSPATGGYYPIVSCGVYQNGTRIGDLNVVDGLVSNNFSPPSSYGFFMASFPSAVQIVTPELNFGSYYFEVQNATLYTAGFSITVTELSK